MAGTSLWHRPERNVPRGHRGSPPRGITNSREWRAGVSAVRCGTLLAGSSRTAMEPGDQRTSSGSWIIGVITAILTVAGCASSPPKSSPAVAAADYSATRDRVVSTSLKYVGAPYERGGTSPAGFDCSGFVLFVYAQAGVALPHGVAKQYRLGSAVSRDELEPGDIVFFDRLRHSGIYIGDTRFVHATKPGNVVMVSRLDEEWFRRRWIGARRLL